MLNNEKKKIKKIKEFLAFFKIKNKVEINKRLNYLYIIVYKR